MFAIQGIMNIKFASDMLEDKCIGCRMQ